MALDGSLDFAQIHGKESWRRPSNRPSHIAMIRYTSLFALGALAACSGGPAPNAKDPAIEQASRRKQLAREETLARQNSLPQVMLDLDRALDEYFKTVLKGSDDRAIGRKLTLKKIIWEKTQENFAALVAKANNPEDSGHRGIALVALGFAGSPEVVVNETKQSYVERALDPLVTALSDEDEWIVNQTLHGLGLLSARYTPVGNIGDILEDDESTLSLKRAASWSLMVMQENLPPAERREILPIWLRVLSKPIGDVEPEVAVQSLHALGQFRRAQDASVAEPYCDHPTPLVRARAAIALGMMKNQDSHKKLIELIKPSETNSNVRLASRKALAALAGGTDKGYDVVEWVKLFQRK